MIPSSRFHAQPATKDCRLTHGINLDYRKTFLEINSTFDSPRDYSQRIQSDDVHRNREAAPEAERMKTSHTREDTPRHVQNRPRRTRKGPKPACVQTPLDSGWHTHGKKGELTSCRGAVKPAWEKPPVRRKEEEPGYPQGQVAASGTGMTVPR